METLAAPLTVEAQPAGKGTPKLGYLSNSGGHSVPDNAFLQGLRDLGFVEGQNLIIIEARYTEGRSERFSGFAADLVRLGVQVIAAWSPAGLRPQKRRRTRSPSLASLWVPTRSDRDGSPVWPDRIATSPDFPVARFG